jgi:hypothetical protein
VCARVACAFYDTCKNIVRRLGIITITMAQDFIGLQMLVTLNNPVGQQMKGRVSEIDPGQSLTLIDGVLFLFPARDHCSPLTCVL